MKTMKLALLATAAVAAVTTAARADDLSALKAQVEALNARVAQMEAAPALPTGYSLLTTAANDGFLMYGEKTADNLGRGHTLSVLPTADMPAATSISWALEVRASIDYSDSDAGTADDTNVGISARGRIRVKASTDTSVGKVGVDMRLEAIASDVGLGSWNSIDPSVDMDIIWGYWQITPEWQLAGGYAASLTDTSTGFDGLITYGDSIGLQTLDNEQFQITYASGPIVWAIALEDNDFSDAGIAVASRLLYVGDGWVAGVVGAYWPVEGDELPGLGFSVDDAWAIGAAAQTNIGDMGLVSVNGAYYSDSHWAITGYGRVNLSDAAYFELGAGRVGGTQNAALSATANDEFCAVSTVGGLGHDACHNYTQVNAGIYYQPVDQLRIGLQADKTWAKGSVDPMSASFVTWFSF
ncbi:MAG TPA: hypothetical protein PKE19_03045 [Aestuariivirga sp.]|nr:hypothetical protein [Aestuariivirga sp.]